MATRRSCLTKRLCLSFIDMPVLAIMPHHTARQVLAGIPGGPGCVHVGRFRCLFWRPTGVGIAKSHRMSRSGWAKLFVAATTAAWLCLARVGNAELVSVPLERQA